MFRMNLSPFSGYENCTEGGSRDHLHAITTKRRVGAELEESLTLPLDSDDLLSSRPGRFTQRIHPRHPSYRLIRPTTAALEAVVKSYLVQSVSET
jgi:hypothetical protein